jgi:hypothetical protein
MKKIFVQFFLFSILVATSSPVFGQETRPYTKILHGEIAEAASEFGVKWTVGEEDPTPLNTHAIALSACRQLIFLDENNLPAINDIDTIGTLFEVFETDHKNQFLTDPKNPNAKYISLFPQYVFRTSVQYYCPEALLQVNKYFMKKGTL